MRKAIFILLALGSWGVSNAQTDILDARTNFDIDDEVTVTGIVTNDGGLGTVRYIQDESAAIAIYPGNAWDGFDEPALGDEITVTGVLTEFNGLLEVGPSLSSVTINSSGNDLPEFQNVSPDAFGEDLEGELVSIEGCVFTFGGGCGGSTAAPMIEGGTTYSFTSNGEVGVVFFRSENPLLDLLCQRARSRSMECYHSSRFQVKVVISFCPGMLTTWRRLQLSIWLQVLVSLIC